MRFTYYAEIWDTVRNVAISERKPLMVDVSGNPPVITVLERLEVKIDADSPAAVFRIYTDKVSRVPVSERPVRTVCEGQSVRADNLVEKPVTKIEKDYWRQGYVMDTAHTKHMSPNERAHYEEQEARMIFRNFLFEDEGRSRQRVAVFDSAKDAERAVIDHNAAEDARETD